MPVDDGETKPISVRITPEAKALVTRLAADKGMLEWALTSRVYEWFAQQEFVVQRAVLGWTIDKEEVEKARKSFNPLAFPDKG